VRPCNVPALRKRWRYCSSGCQNDCGTRETFPRSIEGIILISIARYQFCIFNSKVTVC
jgi:hypothetical protein